MAVDDDEAFGQQFMLDTAQNALNHFDRFLVGIRSASQENDAGAFLRHLRHESPEIEVGSDDDTRFGAGPQEQRRVCGVPGANIRCVDGVVAKIPQKRAEQRRERHVDEKSHAA
jgi:hypothetical protein